MTSNFIPNSFQTPNVYVDQYMAFLTPAEYKDILGELDEARPIIFRQEMLKKYDYRCYVCDIHPASLFDLHMYRVKPGRYGGQYIEENVVILCRKHHARLEGKNWDAVYEMKNNN